MNCPYCKIHIEVHPASRCLRGWVASSVMEWQVINSRDGLPAHAITDEGNNVYLLPDLGPMWFPDFDISCAWEVLEKLSAEGYSYQVLKHSNPERGDCLCELWKDFYRWIVNHQETVPLAICRVTIKAKGTQ